MVSKREVNLGEAVNPGQALFTVVDARTLELAGEVSVQTAAKLKPGARVEFDVEACPGERFAGRVARVEPVADPDTRRVGVYLQLANDGRLVGGVFATGRVELGERTTGLTVPLAALRGSGDSLFVWLVRRGSTVRQAVQLLARDENSSLAQVKGALQAGDTLVVSPGELKEGIPLRIARREANAGGAR
jgi:RND family efflux transporter MFP subunit